MTTSQKLKQLNVDTFTVIVIVELQKLDDKCADLILIDPPYNIGKDEWDDFGITRKGYQPKPYSGESYYDWMEEVFIQLNRVMKDSGSFWFFHNDFMHHGRVR